MISKPLDCFLICCLIPHFFLGFHATTFWSKNTIFLYPWLNFKVKLWKLFCPLKGLCYWWNMPLPFGLKLKRTRRYTVSSKSCLVTRIQLLNGEFVEFTLSVESTGQECLEAVAQRLELREVCIVLSWCKICVWEGYCLWMLKHKSQSVLKCICPLSAHDNAYSTTII